MTRILLMKNQLDCHRQAQEDYLLKKAMKLQVLDPLPRQDVPHLY